MNYRAFRSSALLLLVLSLGALSCDLGDLTGGGKPTVVITSPPSGSQYQEGQDVAIQSTSTDDKGIVRVELLVDGVAVRTDPLPNPQPQFALIQTWKATQGTHTLTVRAYNTSNTPSDPVAISVAVSPSVALGVTPSLPVGPTVTPAPGATATSGSGSCSNDSAFVADVTVPDGTVLAAGQAFNKIWRVRNAGTCPWGVGYDFAFVGGEAMAGTTVVAVPTTNPGATADILIPMTASASAGTHSGQWRLRASGVPFGATLSVSINVPPSAPPCPGPPVIASFTASPNPITAGNSTTLSWGAVTNATSAVIDQGVGGIATPGNRSVSPPSTRTYTLTATGCGGVATSQVVVTVNPAPANTPTPTPTPVPVANFGGHWIHNFGTMDITQSGSSVTGTYHNSFTGGNGTVAGTVSGNTLNGTWTIGGSGTLQFTLGGGGNTFDGNWSGSNQWCGARSGVAFPGGCSYAGSWTNHVAGNSNCSMTLTRVDNTVTGTYCNSTVSGTVSYTGSSSETILNGVWGGGPGTFKFYLLGYNGDRFQGNWGVTPATHYWCGWRSGSSEPSPCYR